MHACRGSLAAAPPITTFGLPLRWAGGDLDNGVLLETMQGLFDVLVTLFKRQILLNLLNQLSNIRPLSIELRLIDHHAPAWVSKRPPSRTGSKSMAWELPSSKPTWKRDSYRESLLRRRGKWGVPSRLSTWCSTRFYAASDSSGCLINDSAGIPSPLCSFQIILRVSGRLWLRTS
jgi:hypothetical protein